MANNKQSASIKMSVLLLIISIPLIITLIASIIFSSLEMKKIEANDEEVYFDMLYTISNGLINADRDLYQACLQEHRL